MNTGDFAFLSALIKDRSGLALGDDKLYLLNSRLLPIARSHGLETLEDLIKLIRRNGNAALVSEIVEAMTTNESLFFRDMKPFDHFQKHALPVIMDALRSTKRFRIWSASCSTGQEPYSIAMMLKEDAGKLAGWRIEIVGTDLSKEVLEKAKAGLYSQFEVQRGLPVQYLTRYFAKNGDMWQIDSAIRAMVRYQPFNLLDRLGGLGHFDIVFCRNVLIYFDTETKTRILNSIQCLMPADGVLYLGGAETVLGVTDQFVPLANHRGAYGPVSCVRAAQWRA